MSEDNYEMTARLSAFLRLFEERATWFEYSELCKSVKLALDPTKQFSWRSYHPMNEWMIPFFDKFSIGELRRLDDYLSYAAESMEDVETRNIKAYRHLFLEDLEDWKEKVAEDRPDDPFWEKTTLAHGFGFHTAQFYCDHPEKLSDKAVDAFVGLLELRCTQVQIEDLRNLLGVILKLPREEHDEHLEAYKGTIGWMRQRLFEMSLDQLALLPEYLTPERALWKKFEDRCFKAYQPLFEEEVEEWRQLVEEGDETPYWDEISMTLGFGYQTVKDYFA